MKILHTTDLHFNQKWFKWIENQQSSFDIFCISGDFLDSSKDETLAKQIVWVTEWIKKIEKPLFVCSGNHDIEKLNNEEWLNTIDTLNYYPDNTIKTIGNIKFGCYPYIGGEGYYEFDKCDILLHHIPPANTKTSTLKNGNDWGDQELYDALKRKIITPKIILSGHVHSPKNTRDTIEETTIYNPGYSAQTNIPDHQVIKWNCEV